METLVSCEMSMWWNEKAGEMRRLMKVMESALTKEGRYEELVLLLKQSTPDQFFLKECRLREINPCWFRDSGWSTNNMKMNHSIIFLSAMIGCQGRRFVSLHDHSLKVVHRETTRWYNTQFKKATTSYTCVAPARMTLIEALYHRKII